MDKRAPPGRSSSPGAARARRARARRRAGNKILRVEVNQRRLLAALRAANRLDDSTDEAVELAAGQVLGDFIDRWLLAKKPCA
jgi:hypothetical protein